MKFKKKILSNPFHILFLIFVFCAVVLFAKKGIDAINANAEIKDRTVIVIDPGHGGVDPGKVGINNQLEKDINLQIAKKLKTFLEQNDIIVVMTREDDNGLYSDGDKNKKNADMKKRIEIIKNAEPTIVISIHQNSFGQESSKGAQMFYHNQSAQGKVLAELIQQQIKDDLTPNNNRKPKGNTSYYILKNTNCPTVIAECGFLSNGEEAKLLSEEYYQEKMAWSIHLAILKFLSQHS